MKKLALALTFALLAPAAPMLARGGEAQSVAVQTGDLDLATDAGVQALYGRIKTAARQVCKGAEGRSAAMRRDHAKCLGTAMESGVMAANNDALSRLHFERMPNATTVAAK
jgi:UrcA family protein